MNLVISATGMLGGAICRKLIAAGKPVRGLVRKTADPAKLAELTTMGVALAYGDLRDPASLAEACKGVDVVVACATTTMSRQPGDSIEATDQQGHLNAIAAAKAAGVKRYVYVSYSGNMDNGPDPSPLTVAKRTVEAAVRAGGMDYAILRPSYFMEVWLSPALGFDYPNCKVTLYGAGHNKVSWISFADVAAFAALMVDHPKARNVEIELGGPQALGPLEVVTIFEDAGGRPFEVANVPLEALQAQKASAPDSLNKSFSGLMVSVALGDAIDMSGTLRDFPVTLTSVKDYARRVLAPQQHAVPQNA